MNKRKTLYCCILCTSIFFIGCSKGDQNKNEFSKSAREELVDASNALGSEYEEQQESNPFYNPYLSYMTQPGSSSSQEEKEKWEKKMSWFGHYGGYSIDGGPMTIVTSAFDPKILMQISIWERDGLDYLWKEKNGTSLFVIDGETVSEILQKEFIDSLTDNEKIIWNGGVLFSIDIDDFEEAVAGVEQKYKEQINSKGISIKDMIRDEMEGDE